MRALILIILLSGPAYSGWRPAPISGIEQEEKNRAISYNLNNAAIQINRKIDKFGKDTIYSDLSFVGESTFTGTVTLPTRDKIVFGNEINNSSSTTIATFSTTQTEQAPCVTGSTLTITTQGNSKIMLMFTGVGSANADSYLRIGATLDGANITGGALTAGRSPGSNWNMNMSFSYLTGTLSAGSHSLCLNFWVNGNTGYINESSASSGANYATFSIMEIR